MAATADAPRQATLGQAVAIVYGELAGLTGRVSGLRETQLVIELPTLGAGVFAILDAGQCELVT